MPSLPPLRLSSVCALFATLLLGSGLAGCTYDKTSQKPRLKRGEHAVQVNATSVGPVQPGTPFLVTPPARDPGAEATLLYAETARLVKSALMAKGLYEAPGRAQAGVIVEIEFSMETPRVGRASSTDPAQGQGGGGNPGRSDPRSSATDANVRSAERGPLAKNLVLTAREAKTGGGPPRTLWSVELSTVDNSNDLRKYLPLLAAAAIDQIGTDTDGPRTVTINETDKSVALLRQAR